MSGFVPALREQLVAAAAREQARRRPRLPVFSPRALVTAAAVTAVLALVVIAVAGGLREQPRVGDRPAPNREVGGRELFGGSLEPDVRYRTRAFVPALSFAVADDDWFVRDATLRTFLAIERRSRTDEPGSETGPEAALEFMRLVQVYDPRIRGRQASLSAGPADVYEWFRDHPDLRVGARQPVTIAGVPGEVFDMTVRFDRPAHPTRCLKPFGQYDVPVEATCAQLAPGGALLDGTRLHTYVLATEPDPLVINLVALPGGDLDALAEAAAPVLDSLRIGVR